MKNGDLIVQTTFCHRQYDASGKQTLQLGFKPYPNSVFVSLMLGGTAKAKASTFDATAALNRLGWYGLEGAELDTVLAALRRWQQHLRDVQRNDRAADPELNAIATDDGRHPPLTLEQIDALCERLNFGDDHA